MVCAADGDVIEGRYRLERQVGAGRLGAVWRAIDNVLGRPVAVRLLRAELDADSGELARFRAGAKRASSVTHENVARVFDYNDAAAGQPPFLVMEFVEGQSLAAWPPGR